MAPRRALAMFGAAVVAAAPPHDVMIVRTTHLPRIRDRWHELNLDAFRDGIRGDATYFPNAWVLVVDTHGDANATREARHWAEAFWSQQPRAGKLSFVRAAAPAMYGALQTAANVTLSLPVDERPEFYALLQHTNAIRRYVNFSALHAASGCEGVALLEYESPNGWPCGQFLDRVAHAHSLDGPWTALLGIRDLVSSSAGVPHGTFAMTLRGLEFLSRSGLFDERSMQFARTVNKQNVERFNGVLLDWINRQGRTEANLVPSNCTGSCALENPCSVPLFHKVSGHNHRRRLGVDDHRRRLGDPPCKDSSLLGFRPRGPLPASLARIVAPPPAPDGPCSNLQHVRSKRGRQSCRQHAEAASSPGDLVS